MVTQDNGICRQACFVGILNPELPEVLDNSNLRIVAKIWLLLRIYQ
ncbi:hypothetical protein H6H03_16465 [Nostoc paludosum FACHB-159]|uniref:Uncharacterized protein n=1 Tax=Nostoc paludosum FACHB-159 TaxID=2692908 RepID=A0ABR8K7J4_9NOSO|nr:hypothetical protein [Nostoc paludosum FACHB-159]